MFNKFQIYALAIIIALVVFLFYKVTELNEFTDWTKLISVLALVVGSLITIFIKWLWKIPLLYPWFCEVPNLNGIWQAEIKSEATSNEIRIKEGIEIKQSYKNINIFFETDESRSETMAANFVKAVDGYQLLYIYRNEPNNSLRKRSQMHHGAVKLHWNEKKIDVLQGHYWTDRQTTGSIYLVKES